MLMNKAKYKSGLALAVIVVLISATPQAPAETSSTIKAVFQALKEGRSAVTLRLLRMLDNKDKPKVEDGRKAVSFYADKDACRVSDMKSNLKHSHSPIVLRVLKIFGANTSPSIAQAPNASAQDLCRLSTALVRYPVKPVERLKPLLEIGDPFLGQGPIRPGIKTPFGQMLQPSFLLFGTLRTALQHSQSNNVTTSDWTNRLDLHGNLHLSGTERLLFSLRPLDSESGNSSGYNFQGGSEGWQNDLNMRISKLYFEGDLGEIFPGLDPSDSHTFDIGFSVGRQRLQLQDGMLMNDIVDMAGITRNSLVFPGVSNLRLTGFYGWNHINRGNNDAVNSLGRVADNTHSADMFGLSAEADTALNNTANLDLLYVLDKQDKNAFYAGVSSTQRFAGWLNSTFRANVSIPERDESPTVGKGALLLAQLSMAPTGTDNNLYLNTFWGIDRFTSAARSPDQGGPVSSLGVLFGPVGMGSYGVPLGRSTDNTVGTALGYQMFLGGIDKQLILEAGARTGTRSDKADGVAGIGGRYQQSLGDRHVWRVDAYAGLQEKEGFEHGLRTEWMIKF